MVKTNKSDWGSQDNIVLTLIRFSLPLILSGILQQLYNWADAFIVGNVDGEVALGAIGLPTGSEATIWKPFQRSWLLFPWFLL